MVITHGRSLLQPNEICYKNMLIFLSLFEISTSSDSFGDGIEAHKNRFIEKMLEISAVWIDFTPTRFDRQARSLQQRITSFYAEANGIFRHFL